MPIAMAIQKNHWNKKRNIKDLLVKELNFFKNLFSVVALPQTKEESFEDDVTNDNVRNTEEKEVPKRARSIAELEEKLEKLKSQRKFNLKNKLVKKSLNSKLNKKIKKKERQKNKVKESRDKPEIQSQESSTLDKKPNIKSTKPVFNTDGKLVFSKFDFSSVNNHDRAHNKKEKDPKKILENLKQQEQKFKELENIENGGKVKEIKEKLAWKNILQKAEGQKVKDDPILLKKSIKKMDQKKKHSKKQWDKRTQNVEQKKEERQTKRRENISKKKKEKKQKVVKAAVKRGRVVI